MHRTRRSFKATLNAALRAGLRGKPSKAGSAPFVVKARPMGLRSGFASANFNRLADELELAAFTSKTRRGKTA
ncbi:MAG: antitoxin [Planctomycetota bacterium]|nr:antitoxin [Planctomycetota bacterium]